MSDTDRPGPPTGVATGVGSMPGRDPRSAAEVVAGEVELVALPELPDRGIGSDIIGRCAALLVGIPMDTSASGYRLANGTSMMARRARDMLAADLDAFEEIWETRGLKGDRPWVKVQVCGPFTLAASVEMANGHKALHDRGAWTDLVGSIAEGAANHAAELRRRLGADVIVQIDEPLIDRVIEGSITPLSRLDVIDPVPAATVAEHLDTLVDVVGGPVILHHCGRRFPWQVAAQTRLWGVSLDIDSIGVRRGSTADLDGFGELIDRGTVVALGAVPSTRPTPERHVEHVVDAVTALVDTIGISHDVFTEQMIITPTCGLAGADTDWARAALTMATAVAEALPQQ
ncbi:vitamin-B12 independent methionine synthase [Williamsia herbipolensis]|uniref:Vitamin-B12 independent methionine synthase n=1 Tax=Williamsia herbipolensis TaxID=1603258 RepID=A0AAU4K5C4_9NOCA|nr:vitamin-B12 independent methionine synthase [Williamsia herbipolensis]